MFLSHNLLLKLLANAEIGKQINEVERVLIDFYEEGYDDGFRYGFLLVMSGVDAYVAKVEQNR